MRIAIEGCTHGELEKTYQTIKQIEERDGQKVDLLLCCGDFQSTRNLSDLACMACPDKYKSMCTFYKYYSGEAIAPVLTIFIGGNHEASNYLQELAYGGWVAPNIYYLGYAGVVEVNGVRIGGLSGIYKGHDYLFGHYEFPPYDDSTSRSAYHIRNVEVFRLKQLEENPPDIMLSHDWPRGVTDFGDVDRLLRFKKHFRDEIEQDKLGSPPARDIMDTLKPKYWFSAHLHCKFAALVSYEGSESKTKFLALDKCLPRRQFLQVLNIGEPLNDEDTPTLKYCPDWLAILKSTNHLLSVERKSRYTPGPGSKDRWDFKPSSKEIEDIKSAFKDDLEVPYNFEQTALAYKDVGGKLNMRNVPKPQPTTNSQTTEFCKIMGIHDPMALLLGGSNRGGYSYKTGNHSISRVNHSEVGNDTNEIDLSDIVNEDEKEIDDNETFQDSMLDKSHTPVKQESFPAISLKPISMPEPKLDNSQEQFQAVIDSMSEEKVEQTSINDLFVIDTKGDEAKVEPEVESDHQPIKKLKRRNAAMYASQD